MRAAESNSLPWAAMARGVGVIYFALLPAERDEITEVSDCHGDGCYRRGVRGAWRTFHDSLVPGGMEEQVEDMGIAAS